MPGITMKDLQQIQIDQCGSGIEFSEQHPYMPHQRSGRTRKATQRRPTL